MRRRGLKLASAVVLALAVSAVTAVPANAAPAPDKPHCIVYDNLTEKVLTASFTDVPPEGYSVGDLGRWDNNLISADGVVLAEAIGGSIVKYNNEEQGLGVYQWNTDTFANGVVKEAGMTDGWALLAGEWISIPAWGVSGKYRGLVGTRSFKRTSEDGIYQSKLELCRR